jgi:hypothetical protein
VAGGGDELASDRWIALRLSVASANIDRASDDLREACRGGIFAFTLPQQAGNGELGPGGALGGCATFSGHRPLKKRE